MASRRAAHGMYHCDIREYQRTSHAIEPEAEIGVFHIRKELRREHTNLAKRADPEHRRGSDQVVIAVEAVSNIACIQQFKRPVSPLQPGGTGLPTSVLVHQLR